MRSALIAAALAVFCGGAQAATYSYDFKAEFAGNGLVDHSTATLVDDIRAFATITGTIVFDDTFVETTVGGTRYAAPVLTFDQFDVGQFEVTPHSVSVRNDFGGQDTLKSADSGVNTITSPPGFYDVVRFIFVDDSASAWSDSSFPPLITLSDFTHKDLFFSSSELANNSLTTADSVAYTFTELTPTVAPVPLPAGVWLLGAGLAGLGAMSRRCQG